MITLKDKRIVTYFANNPTLEPEKVMNMVIDMLENIKNDYTENLSATMISNIANQVKLLDSKIEKVDTQTQNITSVISMLQNHKENILADMRLVLKSNTNDYTKDITSIIKDNNGLFISNMQDKLTNKVNPIFREQLQNDMNKCLETIKNDMNKLVNENEKDTLVYENIFITKYDSMCKELKTHIQENIVSKINSIQEYVDKQNTSCVSTKGKISENKMENLLNIRFPDAEIENTTGNKEGQGDFIIRRNISTKGVATKVMVENKCYKEGKNVPKEEVEKFIRDIENLNCHGVFLSQHSGIATKRHFDIDFHGENVLVYLHNVNYDTDKIFNAIQMIDIISSRLDLKTLKTNISNEIMELIRNELLDFIVKQKFLLDTVKKMQKDVIKQIEDLEFPCLSNFLNISDASATKFSETCENCGKVFKDKRSLGSHRKGCKGKKISKDNTILDYS